MLSAKRSLRKGMDLTCANVCKRKPAFSVSRGQYSRAQKGDLQESSKEFGGSVIPALYHLKRIPIYLTIYNLGRSSQGD